MSSAPGIGTQVMTGLGCAHKAWKGKGLWWAESRLRDFKDGFIWVSDSNFCINLACLWILSIWGCTWGHQWPWNYRGETAGFRQMSLPSLTCYDHKPPSGGINRIFGCSFYTWHSCIPPQNHTFLHALRLSTKISGPQWILSLLSGKKLFQAWGLVLGPYLVFTDANLSFHVYSWEVSYLADNPVTKLPPCA